MFRFIGFFKFNLWLLCYRKCLFFITRFSSNYGAGGLIGNSEYTYIYGCYAAGDVSSVALNAGGLVGYFTNYSIENCFARGNVQSASGYVGGLVGK